MQRDDVIQIVNDLEFDKNDFWVVAGSAMCLYGLRAETNDVDLGCTTHLADMLEEKGYQAIRYSDGSRKYDFNEHVEIFENFLFDRSEIVDGIPVISIQGLLEMKRFLGREKDLEDAKKIENYLQKGREV